MTKEQKDLLIKDLSSRLPYGVKFPITVKNPITFEPIETIGTISSINRYGIVSFVWDYEGQEILVKDSLYIKDVKPYLFPLSSMSEEQKEELDKHFDMDSKSLIDGYKNGLRCPHPYFNVQDWYNKNHFDYRDLIPMGLVNDATGLNIY